MSAEALRELRTAALVALGVLLGGVVGGVVWRLLAPLPRFVVRDAGIYFVGAETEVVVAADGWFAVVAATSGLVAALVVFARIRRARVGALLGLVAGGLLASVIAWQVGHLLGPDSLRETAKGLATGAQVDGPLELRAHGVLFVWSIVSTVVYFALIAGLEARHPDDPHLAGSGGTSFPVTVLRPGYDIPAVDQALARIEAGQLAPDEVRDLRFPPTRLRQGYDGAAVDAELAARARALDGLRGVTSREEPGGPARP